MESITKDDGTEDDFGILSLALLQDEGLPAHSKEKERERFVCMDGWMSGDRRALRSSKDRHLGVGLSPTGERATG